MFGFVFGYCLFLYDLDLFGVYLWWVWLGFCLLLNWLFSVCRFACFYVFMNVDLGLGDFVVLWLDFALRLLLFVWVGF